MPTRAPAGPVPAYALPEPAMPALTVAAVIERGDQFLIVEEMVHGRLVLNQPAGHVEPGESLVQAVVRETLEETGWAFLPAAITGIYLWQHPGTARRFLRVAFCGQAVNHDAGRRLDAGIVRALWLGRDDLSVRSGSLRSPMVMRGIDDYLGGSRRAIDTLGNLPRSALLAIALKL